MLGNYRLTNCLLDTTIILGAFFLLLQYLEYSTAPFSISDSVYGSVFFMLTGFHGFHVFVGLLFLLVAKLRLIMGALHTDDHISFELAS
jgi:cytochrome c oxidase subunit 3